MAKRFWFKCSETYMTAPWTLAGVRAESWEQAKERLIAANIPEFMIPGTGFLSCNCIEVMELEDTHTREVVVQGARAHRPKKDHATHERRMTRIFAGLTTE